MKNVGQRFMFIYQRKKMSKGSKQRPIKDRKKFEENWEKIFKKEKPNAGNRRKS